MRRLPGQGLVYIGPQTLDVDVQLILAARVQGVDGEADEPSGHGPARRSLSSDRGYRFSAPAPWAGSRTVLRDPYK